LLNRKVNDYGLELHNGGSILTVVESAGHFFHSQEPGAVPVEVPGLPEIHSILLELPDDKDYWNCWIC